MKKFSKALIASCIAIMGFPLAVQAAPITSQTASTGTANYNSGAVTQQFYSNQTATPLRQTPITNTTQTTMSSTVSSQTSTQNASSTSSSSSQTNQKNNGGDLTFAQPFQNTSTTLSGKSVRSTMYFTKVNYWNVKKATFNMTYSISQLSNDQNSNITIAINGIKFYSFKPNKSGEQQTINVSIPTNLIQSSNVLTVEGQIVNNGQSQSAPATPAHWLTIYGGSNVNFTYSINQPKNTISSFYDHFVGQDTIANQQSVILVPNNASTSEIAAATYALTGVSRLITTSNAKIEMNTFSNSTYAKRPYQIVIAKYDNLPHKYKKHISASNVDDDQACLKFVNGKEKILVVTSKNSDALIKAGRYIANQELMQETAADTKTVTADTQTFSSDTQTNGYFPLKGNNTKLVGPGHQEQTFFVSLPHDQTNSNGSYVNLNFRYADNLDFKTSLVTVYVNNKPIGSKHLTSADANDDHFRVKIPNNTSLNNALTIRVAFDLNMKDEDDNSQTPWAYVENDSDVFVKSAEKDTMLFSNYPSCFISDKTFNDIGVQLPDKMNSTYYQALSNIFSLIGNYAESNVGQIKFYKHEMTDAQMQNHNIIVLGTPDDTSLVKKLNDDLYFKFNKKFTRFVSNEKLSIESTYGKQIGAVQLLFNPYNKNNAALIVTGATPKDVQLASTQIDTQAHIQTLKGDGAVIDSDGQQYAFRFKKKASNEQKVSMFKRLKSNPHFTKYMVLSVIVIALIALTIFLFIRKNGQGKGKNNG